MKEISFNIVSVFNLFGFFTAVLFSLIILKYRKGSRTIQRILAALIFTLGMVILNSFLWTSDIYDFAPHLFKMLPLVYLLIGPLLYLYIQAMTMKSFKPKALHLCHLVPFFINVILYFPHYFNPEQAKITLLESYSDVGQLNIPLFIALIFRFFHLLVYLILSFRLIQRYTSSIKNLFSSEKWVKLIWMKKLVFAIFTVFFSLILFFILKIYGRYLFFKTGTWLSIWETLLILYLSYICFIQPEILRIEDIKKKYERFPLSPRQAERYLNHLLKYMDTHKPYLDSELSIRDLSRQISVPYWHLSRVINEKMHMNFFEFINSYRIEEAKRLLMSKRDNMNILEIAFASGFNSKSAFNLIFKKNLKTTPSQFKQSQK